MLRFKTPEKGLKLLPLDLARHVLPGAFEFRPDLIGRELFAIDGVKLPSHATKSKGTHEDFERLAAQMGTVVQRMIAWHQEEDALSQAQPEAAQCREWLARNPVDFTYSLRRKEMNALKIYAAALVFVISLAGCASGGPKTLLIENSISPEKAAILHPTVVPGGLMLIRRVDEKSTYSLSIGYFGSLYVPPGEHEFEIEVSHGFKVQDAGGPTWTAPQDANISPLISEHGGGLFVVKGVSKLKGKVLPGKVYEIKFGFDRSIENKPVPVTWLSEVPGT